MQVEAIWENGVLRPIHPLDLIEHERVTVEVLPAGVKSPAPSTDPRLIDAIREQIRTSGPVPGLEDVRRGLAKIPGSLTQDFTEERDER